MIKLRRFRPSDIEQIAKLFHDTIRSVNSADYTEEQVKAWAPDNLYFRDWKTACSSNFTLLAEQDDIITGFAQLEDNGHIDCFYCHKDFQEKGIGKLLYCGIEKEAIERGLIRLFVEVSITAKPFFLNVGFSVLEKQTVSTRGVDFINFRMEKKIKYISTKNSSISSDLLHSINTNQESDCHEKTICSLSIIFYPFFQYSNPIQPGNSKQS